MDQAEKLREIIKKQNQSNESSARIITVTSGKGGVGKSNVSINLALQFRRQGKRVIIFDADFGLANIEVMFGVIPQYTLADLMFKGKEIKDIITEGPEALCLCPAVPESQDWLILIMNRLKDSFIKLLNSKNLPMLSL